MSNEYKITKISDLLNLTNNQINKICGELPELLRNVKLIIELSEDIDGVIKTDLLEPLTWVDDGKEDLTFNFTVKEPDDDN